jgi:hypothetical protein
MKKKVTGGGHDFRRSLFDGPNLVEEVGDMAIVSSIADLMDNVRISLM